MARVARVVADVLDSYDSNRNVTVTATGVMLYDDWIDNIGGRQNVTISIIDTTT
jgi:hypothetical protein